jgi:hypothetical protein
MGIDDLWLSDEVWGKAAPSPDSVARSCPTGCRPTAALAAAGGVEVAPRNASCTSPDVRTKLRVFLRTHSEELYQGCCDALVAVIKTLGYEGEISVPMSDEEFLEELKAMGQDAEEEAP